MALAATSPPAAAPAGALTNEEKLSELVDEIVYAQRQTDQWASCCEALLSYTTLLEQHILLPAFGSLAKLLNDFHTVREARARGEAVVASTVNASDHPQLARAFATMSKPEATTMHQMERQELLSGPPPTDVDDAYVSLLGFLRRQQRLIDLVADARSGVPVADDGSGARASASPASRRGGDETAALRDDLERSNADRLRLQRELDMLRGAAIGSGDHSSSIAAELKRQLDMAEQRNASQAQLARQETELLTSRLETVTRECEELRSKHRATEPFEALYRQATAERDLLRERVAGLEDQIRQNEVDRAAVAESFEVLQSALESAGNPVALQQASVAHSQKSRVLENEVRSLRQQLDDAKKDAEQQQDEHSRTMKDLRRKLKYAQNQAQQAKLGLALEGGAAADGSALVDVPTGDQSSSLAVALGQLGKSGDSGNSNPRTNEAARTKLRAFEMTIAALNAELAQLEDKIVETERHYAEDRAVMERKAVQERERFEAEQAECDTVLATISAELEQCMKENADLRSRLHAQFHSQQRSR